MGIKPDLLLILVLFVGLYRGPVSGAWCGFLSGMLLDFFSPTPLGINTLSKTILGFLIGQLAPFLYFEFPLIQGLLLFIATFLEGILLFVLLSSFQFIPPFFYSLCYVIFPASCYTAFCAPLLFYFFRKIKVSDYAF
jgi:rod shape-determining protein MreD